MHAILPPSSQQAVAPDFFAQAAEQAASAPRRKHPMGEQTVLIVDDDAALRNTAAMMLECHGFKTLVASNGLEALTQLEQNPQVSVVLLDLLMPVMDGEETFRQMRNFWHAIPVILISGFDLGDVAHRLGESFPDGYVQKPFTLARLAGVVTGLLN